MHLWLIPEDIGVADAMIEACYSVSKPSYGAWQRHSYGD
jgi:hypothetical protein